jgi:hypothetical protein
VSSPRCCAYRQRRRSTTAVEDSKLRFSSAAHPISGWASCCDTIMPVKSALVLPTEENVRRACKQFDDDNLVVEEALKDLFTQYPRNNNHPHVLLKVVALNRLYSAGIYAVYDTARHIHEHAREIDSGLAAGAPEVVDIITAVPITATGKVRHFWAFATKYCSWHNPNSYPIWDSHVARYLRSLEGTPFAHPDFWHHYREFRDLMVAFREHYKLAAVMFKEIDKFLYRMAPKAPTRRDQ